MTSYHAYGSVEWFWSILNQIQLDFILLCYYFSFFLSIIFMNNEWSIYFKHGMRLLGENPRPFFPDFTVEVLQFVQDTYLLP